jgi:hypothetical protein
VLLEHEVPIPRKLSQATLADNPATGDNSLGESRGRPSTGCFRNPGPSQLFLRHDATTFLSLRVSFRLFLEKRRPKCQKSGCAARLLKHGRPARPPQSPLDVTSCRLASLRPTRLFNRSINLHASAQRAPV